MHKLFLFNNTNPPSHGWNVCYSITDKGHILGSHVCSHSGYMEFDLHERSDRLINIQEHFNNEPYELIIIPDDEVSTHPELQEAFRLNKILHEEKEKSEGTEPTNNE